MEQIQVMVRDQIEFARLSLNFATYQKVLLAVWIVRDPLRKLLKSNAFLNVAIVPVDGQIIAIRKAEQSV